MRPSPWAYVCQEGCGEIATTHVYTAPPDGRAADITYHHYTAAPERHAVRRVRRREAVTDAAAERGEAHGPSVR